MAARYVVGLTGNIASGKSAVATMLAELGADVIDADHVVHEVYSSGAPEVAAIRDRFGPTVIAADGSIDRAALGHLAFADRAAMADLEAIVHPAVRERIRSRIATTEAAVAVIEAIKLIEGPLAQMCDAIWVVTAPREQRIARLMATRGLAEPEAAQRVDAQNPEAEKVRAADIVLENTGTIQELHRQVLAAWRDVESELTARAEYH
ncbi:MAG: dephospho-CoA kinase [Chloroflexota bacterium]|nr:dephospho-CoA kinase [Chloroflexota bacterium]